MKGSNSKKVVLASMMVALAAISLQACSGAGGDKGKDKDKAKKDEKAAERPGQSVSVEEVAPRNFAPHLVLAGQVQAIQSARVFPTAQGAQVVRLLADAGDHVNAGQVLAVLDATQISADRELLAAQVRRAQTALAEAEVGVRAAEQNLARLSVEERESQLNLRQAEIAYEQARSEYQRAQATTAEGALSQEAVEGRRAAMDLAAARLSGQRGDIRAIGEGRRQQLDQARARAQAAQSDLAVAVAQQRQANVRNNAGNVVAPVSGLVTSRNVSIGEIAGAGGQPMFVITANGALELAAELPESDLSHVVPGMLANFRAPDGSTVTGVLRRMPAQIDPTRRTGIARFTLEPSPMVRDGMFLTGESNSSPRGVLAVRASALIYDADGTSVFVVGADSRVHKVPVTVGQREGAYAELLTGPQAGALVVTAGAAFLAENERITPKREETGAATGTGAPATARPAARPAAAPATPAARPATPAARPAAAPAGNHK